MRVVTVHQAKTQLSELLAEVSQGEDVVIAEGKRPVARIIRFDTPRARRPGRLKGQIALTPAFFEPLPTDEITAWGED